MAEEEASHTFPPVSTLSEFGGEMLELSEGYCLIRYPVTERHCNPRGTLQGGMFSVYLDDAMGYAMVAKMGEDAPFATTDLTVHYLKRVHPGLVLAEGKVVRVGRRSAYLEGEVRLEDGSLCARASSTMIRLG
jgi:uncharacterized protein (TIGR00369 family)